MIGVDLPPFCMHQQLWPNQGGAQVSVSLEPGGKASHGDGYSPIWVEGAIVVGAGPAGLAVAATLKHRGVPSLVLERAECIGSLWQHSTYDRLHLHLPKTYCELPMLSYPDHVPRYPTRQQFLDYILSYAETFNIKPRFGRCVRSASYDASSGIWRVVAETVGSCSRSTLKEEFMSRFLVVATGENAEPRVPRDLPGFDSFAGHIVHSSSYTNGKRYAGKRVLVVGSGNSGMEIALDLLSFGARPSIIFRSPTHILPRDMFGCSTFAVAMSVMRLLPLYLADKLLVLYASFALGNTEKYGIVRPRTGPLETKVKLGKTPILDMGAYEKIRSGNIKVMPGLQGLTPNGANFVDGQSQPYDAIVFATGFHSNISRWLKDKRFDFADDGTPKSSWNCGQGLYVAGMTRQGIFGASRDAVAIAEDISKTYMQEQRTIVRRT